MAGITRLGLAGIPRGLYGSFAGKVVEVIIARTTLVLDLLTGELLLLNKPFLVANEDLQHTGDSVGFYGTLAVAQQTGVPVTAAGIHAALVALGLFTA